MIPTVQFPFWLRDSIGTQMQEKGMGLKCPKIFWTKERNNPNKDNPRLASQGIVQIKSPMDGLDL